MGTFLKGGHCKTSNSMYEHLLRSFFDNQIFFIVFEKKE